MNLLQIHEPGQTPEPHADTIAVGIDLGTTHSVVAIMHEGKPHAIEEPSGRSIIPSIVRYDDGIQVGGTSDGITSIKRLMGKSFEESKQLLPHLSEKMHSGEHDAVPRVSLGEQSYTPIEISAEILKYLKHIAEEATDKEVAKAVITVPAYFDDAARLATKDAARLAGLEVLRLINEPTAAAMAYGLEHEAEGVYAIYDLGGGTFDFSLLNLEKGVFQVLATAGDTELGGDDIDRAIASHWQPKEVISLELLRKARKAKESLSEQQKVEIDSYHLDREMLKTLCQPFVERTLAICTQALEDADCNISDIHGVVLVGGSTRLQAVREAAESHFEMKPLDHVDPDRVVAYGAAQQAYNLTSGGDQLLLDVIPLSLGIETIGDLAEKLIYRNTPIPVTVSQEFTTYQDSQQGMKIHVVQGERELASQCRSLARFELKGIPPMVAGAARIEVTFQVDADGLLTVSAEEKTTNTKQSVEVRPSYGLAVDTIEHMIRESMEHAREDMTRRLLGEARVESERMIQDLLSALEKDGSLLNKEEKQPILDAVDALQDATQGEDRDKIDYMLQELQRISALFAQKRMDKAIGSTLKGMSIEDV